jgi:hypothetical protein
LLELHFLLLVWICIYPFQASLLLRATKVEKHFKISHILELWQFHGILCLTRWWKRITMEITSNKNANTILFLYLHTFNCNSFTKQIFGNSIKPSQFNFVQEALQNWKMPNKDLPSCYVAKQGNSVNPKEY